MLTVEQKRSTNANAEIETVVGTAGGTMTMSEIATTTVTTIANVVEDGMMKAITMMRAARGIGSAIGRRCWNLPGD